MTGIEMLREFAKCMLSEDVCSRVPNALGKKCDDFMGCGKCYKFVCNAIADQIERETERETERTCRDKNGGQRSMGFECTRCETQCEHIYNMCTGEIDLPTYCPGCGAKVVME